MLRGDVQNLVRKRAGDTPETSCDRCRRRQSKYDQAQRQRANNTAEIARQRRERIALWIGDLKRERLVVGIDHIDAGDMMAIARLRDRHPTQPYDQITSSWSHGVGKDDQIDIIYALFGIDE